MELRKWMPLQGSRLSWRQFLGNRPILPLLYMSVLIFHAQHDEEMEKRMCSTAFAPKQPMYTVKTFKHDRKLSPKRRKHSKQGHGRRINIDVKQDTCSCRSVRRSTTPAQNLPPRMMNKRCIGVISITVEHKDPELEEICRATVTWSLCCRAINDWIIERTDRPKLGTFSIQDNRRVAKQTNAGRNWNMKRCGKQQRYTAAIVEKRPMPRRIRAKRTRAQGTTALTKGKDRMR